MKNPTLSVADVEAAFLNEEQAANSNEPGAWSIGALESMPFATLLTAGKYGLDTNDGAASDPDARRLLRGALNVALVSHESLRLVVPDALLDAIEVAKIGESSVQSAIDGERMSDQAGMISNAGQPATFTPAAAVQETVSPGAISSFQLIDHHALAGAMQAERDVEDAQGVDAFARLPCASDQVVCVELIPGDQVEITDAAVMSKTVNDIADLSVRDVLESGGEPLFMEADDFLLLIDARSEVSLELEDLLVEFSDSNGQVFSEIAVQSEDVLQGVHVAGVEAIPLDSEGVKDVF
ncbi:hypothetical protein [Pseudomonas sp. URMO17WK12:I11]|uniref:hypothetical protein n=1 Tax=Pseudomonas sp. URMO17WK12:I11 TaxID=1283291 RepID=UPI00071FAB10|nr:hypothetical protein [Pseudomonas sp. URMO17WK12:I11]CRL51653.1 hypothetical protein PSHI_48460 [Pseudomonas sp. URMO17WK12:I11]